MKKYYTLNDDEGSRDLLIWASKVFVLVFVFYFFFTIGRVQGVSMEPTLKSGSLFIQNNIVINEKFHRGDIVTLRHSDPNMLNSNILLKRIIGIPGDKITLDNKTGIVWINGDKECNVIGGYEIMETYYFGDPLDPAECKEITLNEREYFVLGDNRPNSLDSRDFGVVEEDKIYSKMGLVFKVPFSTTREE